jgi:hypothetical protein
MHNKGGCEAIIEIKRNELYTKNKRVDIYFCNKPIEYDVKFVFGIKKACEEHAKMWLENFKNITITKIIKEI